MTTLKELEVESGKLYYLKVRGYYVKVESIVPRQQGRRKKWTFDEMVKFKEDWDASCKDSEFSINFHEFFEVVDIDEKYEKKQEELEMKELIRRENEVDPEQLSMFEIYAE
ncbi:hypothetical protein [Carnobacterium maltaromaticum]|uniref:hypothetical protein n=2 Tax=Carnobacterium maltaromaticum TaxID=2751 RepID=UPI00026C878A|nr:hypothetical protein [Carnobacterium maltaromaticum]